MFLLMDLMFFCKSANEFDGFFANLLMVLVNLLMELMVYLVNLLMELVIFLNSLLELMVFSESADGVDAFW